MNLEFNLEPETAPLCFAPIELAPEEQALHSKAIFRTKIYKEAEASLLEVISEVDAVRFYEKFHLTSTHAYCLKYLDLTEHVAYYFINVARKARSIPELKVAIQAGELTVAKATRIVSVLTPENKSEWIEKAKNLSKAQIEREVAKHSPQATGRERVRIVAENVVKYELYLSEAVSEDFRRAQDVMSQKNGQFAGLEATVAQALKEYLDRNDPLRKAERAEKRANSARAEFKPVDNVVELAEEKTGKPETDKLESGKSESCKGHSHRTRIPNSIKHRVNLRDQGRCQVRLPDGGVCGSRRWTETHHIIPVHQGGGNELSNLTTLCSAHHRQWHK